MSCAPVVRRTAGPAGRNRRTRPRDGRSLGECPTRPGTPGRPAGCRVRIQTLRQRRKRRGWTAPLEFVHRGEQRDVGAQGGELAKQECAVAIARQRQRRACSGWLALTCHFAPVGRDRLDVSELARAPPPRTSRPSPAGPDSRPPHRRRAPGSPGMDAGGTPNLAMTPASSASSRVRRFNCTMRVPRTHCAEVLVRRADDDALDARVRAPPAPPPAASASSASNSTIGQTDDAERGQRPPRAAGTARAAPARCRRPSCSPATAGCGTTR